MTIRLTAAFIFGTAVILNGCSKPSYSGDVKKSIEMAVNEPNPIKSPNRIEVHATRSARGIALPRNFDRATNDLVYTSTNEVDILKFVAALRKDPFSYNPGDTIKAEGTTYFFRCMHFGSTNELHYTLFAPTAPSRESFISIGGVLELRGEALLMWLRQRDLLR